MGRTTTDDGLDLTAPQDPPPQPEIGDDEPGAAAPRRRLGPEAIASLFVVVAAVAFTVTQLEPGLLLTDTTPAGGDMGAHVWGPAYLRDTLLPQGKLAGWAPDWYAGFPAYQFYMVVPSLAIVALDLVLPYGIAFKLISVLGVVTLPVAAWALGRLARLPFPGPPLLAVAAVGFLFDRSFSIYGGNISSTLAGEFSFSLSLTVAVLYVGVLLRGTETGRHRALAAALLALCALCHVIPAIFAAAATAVALLLRPGRLPLRWILTTGIVGAALTAFWTVPFVLRRAYLNDMGWERKEELLEGLFPGPLGEALSRAVGGAADAAVPGDITAVAVLAAVGVIVSIARGRRLGIYLTVLGAVAAAGYVLAPQGRLWNARLLPFWYLALYLLAAIAVSEGVRAAAALMARRADEDRSLLRGLSAVVASAIGLATLALPLHALPFGQEQVDGTYRWGPLTTADRSYIPDWVRWNYSGYERKAAYPEYRALIDTMAAVGSDRGCGRAMWEYNPTLDTYGTPMAPMLLPYWTDGCIGSMEGLYFEASATTPYHFINQTELSTSPSQAQRDMPYGSLDVSLGVDHLQMLGVRYYLSFTPEAAAQADVEPDLTYVTSTGPWRVYEVAGSELVEPLEATPAVVEEAAAGGEAWLDPSVAWYVDREAWGVALAADGPETWERVLPGQRPDVRPVAATTVSDVETGDDTVSFSVDEVGVPVVVKTSYFPNWEVSGAEGPWRIAPNLMVVVPTDTEVRLTYGTTGVEWLAWALTAAGLCGLVLLIRRGSLRRSPDPGGADPGPPPAAEVADAFDHRVDELVGAGVDTGSDRTSRTQHEGAAAAQHDGAADVDGAAWAPPPPGAPGDGREPEDAGAGRPAQTVADRSVPPSP